MLRLPLVEYFECPEDAVESLSAGLGELAREGQRKYSEIPLAHHGASTSPECPGDIFLDFTAPEESGDRNQPALNSLRADVLELLGSSNVVNTGTVPSADDYHPHISLMQQAELPPTAFESAVLFAGAVIKDLEIPEETRAWQLVLLRFESDAAGEDWSHGGWAADLRWNLLASYPIQA